MTPDPLERQLADLRPQSLSPAARARLAQALAALPVTASQVTAVLPIRHPWRAWIASPLLGAAAILIVGLALALGSGARPAPAARSAPDLRSELISRHAAVCDALVYDGLQRRRPVPQRFWQQPDS